MPEPEKRYWVYTHDAEDEITEDLGDFDDLIDAISAAIDEGLVENIEHRWARVVDKESQHQTVWMAGPVNPKHGLAPL
jgi:hypothetical protein